MKRLVTVFITIFIFGCSELYVHNPKKLPLSEMAIINAVEPMNPFDEPRLNKTGFLFIEDEQGENIGPAASGTVTQVTIPAGYYLITGSCHFGSLRSNPKLRVQVKAGLVYNLQCRVTKDDKGYLSKAYLFFEEQNAQ